MIVDLRPSLQEIGILRVVPDLQRRQFQRHPATAPGRTVGPHVRSHVYLWEKQRTVLKMYNNKYEHPTIRVGVAFLTHLEIPLCRERLQTHRAPKRFVARVCSHVDLQRRRRREVLVAHVTQVFGRS